MSSESSASASSPLCVTSARFHSTTSTTTTTNVDATPTNSSKTKKVENTKTQETQNDQEENKTTNEREDKMKTENANESVTDKTETPNTTTLGDTESETLPNPEFTNESVVEPFEDSDGFAESNAKASEDTDKASELDLSALRETEVVTGSAEEMTFKAETRQLLDIVACSLYSDKEVFVRELISNASDALEKRRHLELSEPENYAREDTDETPGVAIYAKQAKNQFVIVDTGVGMGKEELVNCLGTICSSGSRAFLNQLKEKGESTKTMESIIGQFGVGFYAAFMVAKNIKVYSRSAAKGSKGYLWESDGHGSYRITECEGVAKGTKIVLEMKDTELAFCTPTVVERIIKKYSNFISFDITLNGNRINTVKALWMKNKSEVSEEEHNDFYKFVSGAYDTPLFKLHYSIDAPLMIHSLLYVPQTHAEKFGGGRQECAVNLYCRKVLIQSKAKNVIPEWLRFLKGVVDCEDLPLNISREHTQDSALIRKLSAVITKRVLKWLDEESRRDATQYEKFIKEFGFFLKEGVCTDTVNKMEIAKLLRFESSHGDTPGVLSSLDQYIDRMPANQTHVYYLTVPSRDTAMVSPYYEQYKLHNLEVLILTEHIDEFVVQHLDSYRKYKMQNIETFDANLDGAVQAKKKIDGDKAETNVQPELSETQCSALADFFTKRLLGKVGMVKATHRLSSSPIVLVDHENAQIRKMMKLMGKQDAPNLKYNIHFNPKHSLIRKLYTLTQSTGSLDIELAGLLAEQLFDNALISAGLCDDPRTIVQRLNAMMSKMVEKVAEPSEVSQKEEVRGETEVKETNNEKHLENGISEAKNAGKEDSEVSQQGEIRGETEAKETKNEKDLGKATAEEKNAGKDAAEKKQAGGKPTTSEKKGAKGRGQKGKKE